eukprot:m.716161 g.716161  ORF g.716161 m.716161 type:complete len:81 (-) comp58794_c1_seq5:754-996(-)
MLLFNFRGVARSRGTLARASDLVLDTQIAYNFLTSSLGARDENILFFGHSIGGAAATAFRARLASFRLQLCRYCLPVLEA